MSKQEKELVAQQLRVESETRLRIDKIYSDARRALALLASIVTARVDILGSYFSDIVQMLLKGAIKFGAALLGENLFDNYLVC